MPVNFLKKEKFTGSDTGMRYRMEMTKREVPKEDGADGETVEETKQNLIEAIELILEDRRLDILRGLPDDAIQEKILVG